MRYPTTATLRTARLVLTALAPTDASEMVDVLSDAELYEFTGGKPPRLEQLEARYQAQLVGPPDPNERWHNWIVRLADSNVAVGFVQATVVDGRADVAWVIGVAWQGRGFAREAVDAMGRWLRDSGIDCITAHIHPNHHASARVAAAVGLRSSDDVDDDGERIWVSSHE